MPAQAHAAPSDRDLFSLLLLAVLLAGTIVFLWFAVSSDAVYMALHVTAATVWVGGGTVLTVLALLTQRARDPHALANLVREADFVSMRVFMPSSLVTLAFGVVLVEKWHIGYGSFWITFALVVWAFSFVLGLVVIAPRLAKLKRLIAEYGVEDALVQRGIAQLLQIARLDTTLLLLVIVDMAAKPNL